MHHTWQCAVDPPLNLLVDFRLCLEVIGFLTTHKQKNLAPMSAQQSHLTVTRVP